MQSTATASGFDVVLVACGDRKIEVIRDVRNLTGLGLKEAKDLVESAPTPIEQGVSREVAEGIRAALLKAGATVEIRRSHSGNGQFHPGHATSFSTGRADHGA